MVSDSYENTVSMFTSNIECYVSNFTYAITR